MSLEVAINENTQAIRELIAALAKGQTPTAAQVQAVREEVTQAEKPKAKAEPKPAPEPKPEPAPEAAPEASAPTPAETFPDTPGVTYQDAAAAITKLSRTKGRDAAVALLYRFKASKLPDVQPDQYFEIIEAAKAAMGE